MGMTLNITWSFFTCWPSLTGTAPRCPPCSARALICRREWIWQTYCWVMTTSLALGLVTTIFRCPSVGSSCLWHAGREREISARRMARMCEIFIEFFAPWLPVGSRVEHGPTRRLGEIGAGAANQQGGVGERNIGRPYRCAGQCAYEMHTTDRQRANRGRLPVWPERESV